MAAKGQRLPAKKIGKYGTTALKSVKINAGGNGTECSESLVQRLRNAVNGGARGKRLLLAMPDKDTVTGF
eukprot:2504752-Lingulodinium_polyedra.AAC.1